MLTIEQRFEIDAGHRLVGHEGKCRNLHGHRYVFLVTLNATGLNELSMIVDFGVVKEIIKKWLDSCWDHGFLASHDEPLAQAMMAEEDKVYFFPTGLQPTIEVIVATLFRVATELLKTDKRTEHVRVVRVKGYETPNCSAEVVE